MSDEAKGPLTGLRVVEFVGIGPGPHCAMLFSDLGADVLRVARPGGNGAPNPIADRGRATLTLDLRDEASTQACLEATDVADVVIEGYRPGVMERLGLGPDIMLGRNPRLIYGRLTGWGQTGPLAAAAGHDINYIALTGALQAIGRPGQPAVPPLNLVGDFGGGSMLLAFGIVAALWERERSGKGQVIDASIVDGVASLMSLFTGLISSGEMSLERDRSMLGGAAPFYRCYECSDHKEIAIGAVEQRFYEKLLSVIEAPADLAAHRDEQPDWARQSAVLEGIFRTKPAKHWQDLLEGSDACFAPVLTLDESFSHPHMVARAVYKTRDGVEHALPVPRFSRTPGEIRPDLDPQVMLAAWREASASIGQTHLTQAASAPER